MEKIIIIGCPGAGKTTLATKLGVLLNIPVHHLDKHFWKESWGHLHQEEFRKIQGELMKEPRWILDGNFTKSIEHRIVNADTVIFFDFSKPVVFWQNLKRYFKNFNKVRHDMGGNNKEALKWEQVKFILGYPRDKVYSMLKQHSKDKQVYILRNPKAVSDLLKKILK